ncbi:unnamed protein product [Ixodes pacificus]
MMVIRMSAALLALALLIVILCVVVEGRNKLPAPPFCPMKKSNRVWVLVCMQKKLRRVARRQLRIKLLRWKSRHKMSTVRLADFVCTKRGTRLLAKSFTKKEILVAIKEGIRCIKLLKSRVRKPL